MTRLRAILAATDLSGPARNAARRAAALAREHSAELHVLHVEETSRLAAARRLLADLSEQMEGGMADAERLARDALARALRDEFSIPVDATMRSGRVLEELPAHADALGADLIVMGARGAGVLRYVLLGSTAERMVSRTSRPLLVARNEQATRPYQRVLVPVDFSASSAPALRLARKIAPHAEITLMHSYEVPFAGKMRYAGVDDAVLVRYSGALRDDAHAQLAALCDAVEVPRGAIVQTVREGDPSREIIELREELGCDLVVMGKHGENFVEELLLGSVTQHVIGAAACDVLVSTAAAAP
jgi:nucleotide-binding universal stress UspA family protein